MRKSLCCSDGKASKSECETTDPLYGSKSSSTYTNWMSELPKSLQNAPLCHIAIPGSHDSATSKLDVNSEVGPDIDSYLRTLVTSLGILGKTVLRNWSVTQYTSIAEQLVIGVRYVDIRVSKREHVDGLWTLHGLFSVDTLALLNDVKTFIDKFPKEVVLLDFNHFYLMEDEDHYLLYAMIVSLFGDSLCPRQELKSLTLQKMWDNDWRLLVFYADTRISSLHDNVWPADNCLSPYCDTDNTPVLMEFLNSQLSKRSPQTFYVSQGILTPKVSSIVASVCSNLYKFEEKLIPLFLEWIYNQKIGSYGVNITIMNFVTEEYIHAVLSLNKVFE